MPIYAKKFYNVPFVNVIDFMSMLLGGILITAITISIPVSVAFACYKLF